MAEDDFTGGILYLPLRALLNVPTTATARTGAEGSRSVQCRSAGQYALDYGAYAASGSLSLWVLAGPFFLVLLAFSVAHLSRLFPNKAACRYGRERHSARWHGFACGWFDYVNNLFWIPGVLIATIGMLAASFPPLVNYVESTAYSLPVFMPLLLVIVVVNYVGLRVRVDNMGGIAVTRSGLS